MTSGFLLQARTGSTRMPRKILLPFFEGRSVLKLLIDRLDVRWIDRTGDRAPGDDVRLTVDTPEDFALLQALYTELHASTGGAITSERVLDYLRDHPAWRSAMRREIGRHKK